MSAARIPRLKDFVLEFAANSAGPALLFFLRAAQRSSNKRQLKKCTRVGERVVAGYGLEVDNSGSISVGDDVSISCRALLSCYSGGAINIARNCFFGDNVKVVSERASISIGEDCLIAENVSIRASNHGIRAGTLIRLQQNVVADITIGKDVWIGCGTTVLAGALIADGCVIGANSVVRGVTEPNAIYAGSPIQKIGHRANK